MIKFFNTPTQTCTIQSCKAQTLYMNSKSTNKTYYCKPHIIETFQNFSALNAMPLFVEANDYVKYQSISFVEEKIKEILRVEQEVVEHFYDLIQKLTQKNREILKLIGIRKKNLTEYKALLVLNNLLHNNLEAEMKIGLHENFIIDFTSFNSFISQILTKKSEITLNKKQIQPNNEIFYEHNSKLKKYDLLSMKVEETPSLIEIPPDGSIINTRAYIFYTGGIESNPINKTTLMVDKNNFSIIKLLPGHGRLFPAIEYFDDTIYIFGGSVRDEISFSK